ncbi:hypothetical protein ACTVCO_08205 [Sanguibacter sp. A247]|uniref:hypothetical protein n=1 Tax=unclassified Sanguibacter TaxID=2645534 RepID=UPI003FD811ED
MRRDGQDDSRRDGFREDRREVPVGPEIPDEVTISDLDREARAHLRSLSKQNAETVGRHLVMVARLFDADPEAAYEHAQAAVARGGRVDIVREAAGLAAYRTERYAEALRELRTVRRLNGSSEHLPVMADCERGLGRPERAIALAQTPEAESLDVETKIELSIVVAGARMDLGESDAALVTLREIDVTGVSRVQHVRVLQAQADILEALGRDDDAAAMLEGVTPAELAAAVGEIEVDEEVLVVDLDDVDMPDDEEPAESESDEEGSNDEGSDRKELAVEDAPGSDSDDVVADAEPTDDVADSAETDAAVAEGALDASATAEVTDAVASDAQASDSGDDAEERA